jgi:hypothetical protein
MRRERSDIARWMEGGEGDLLWSGWMAWISLCCREGKMESGMCGRLGAVLEMGIGDDGVDSGSNRADRTAASWEVRPDG